MRNISKASFYVSYYQAAQKLNENERLAFYDTILNYIFKGVEPKELAFNVDLIFTTIKPFIDADLSRKIGGAPLGNSNAKKQPKNNLENNLENNPKNNLKTNNDNVNVNDNGNVKENESVDSSFLTPKNIYKLLSGYGYEFGETVFNKIILGVSRFDDPESAIIDRLNYIESKYTGKTQDEKNGLFFKSLDWDTIPKTEKPKEQKPKKDIFKNAPKKCTFCGSSLMKYKGSGLVVCPSCTETGVKTFWELDSNDVWKCNRN